MSASTLSAAAAEWRPTAVAPRLPAQADQAVAAHDMPHQQQAEGADSVGAAYGCEEGFYDEDGEWVPFYDADAAEDGAAQQPPSLDDGVAMLQARHPRTPRALLRQLLERCGGDVQQAALILGDVAFEERRERAAAARGAAAAATSTSASASASASTHSSKGKPAFSYALEQFPSLAKDSAAAAGRGSDGSSRGGRTWAAKAAAPARPVLVPSHQQQQQQRQQPQQRSQPSHSRAAASPAAAGGGGAVEVPWVQTGASVSREYADARAEARDHARVRNACFQQATLAYRAGDKALAKELSAKGRAAADAMWAAHERAGGQLFAQRNAKLQQQAAAAGASGGAAIIDLHGLHVQEVRRLLPQQLAAFASQGQHSSVALITGTGHHTTGAPSARLLPAVQALLTELGYSYSSPQPGLVRVRLAC